MAGNTSAPVVQILWPAETADRYDIGTQVIHAHFWNPPLTSLQSNHPCPATLPTELPLS